jgi:hypothetical protein
MIKKAEMIGARPRPCRFRTGPAFVIPPAPSCRGVRCFLVICFIAAANRSLSFMFLRVIARG